MTPKEKLIRIVENAKGDDLERATRAFAGSKLDEEYGQSGKTRLQILQEYQQNRDEWGLAYKLAQSLEDK